MGHVRAAFSALKDRHGNGCEDLDITVILFQIIQVHGINFMPIT